MCLEVKCVVSLPSRELFPLVLFLLDKVCVLSLLSLVIECGCLFSPQNGQFFQ